jgi:heme exporter protein C
MTLAQRGRWVTITGLVLLALVYVRALAFTPTEATQGLAQKIYYIHVPAAVWAEMSMIFIGLASIFFLFLKDPRLIDLRRLRHGSESSLRRWCFTTGPIWGKPIWGTWWTWDARLTLTLLLFFIDLGYLVLRERSPIRGCGPGTQR